MTTYTPQAVKNDFGKAALQYDAHSTLQQDVLHDAALLMVKSQPQGVILDAGCGTGLLAEILDMCIPGLGILGVDIAQPMCDAAHARGMNSICADMENLPLADASVNGVLSSLALQWGNDRKASFREFFRVCRPGAPAVVTVFGEDSLCELKTIFAELDEYGRVSDFQTRATLLKEARMAGWYCEQAFTRWNTPYYPDMYALMHSLKEIGATNKLAGRKRGLTPPSLFLRAARLYQQQYGHARGIPATWQVHYMVLRKPRGAGHAA